MKEKIKKISIVLLTMCVLFSITVVAETIEKKYFKKVYIYTNTGNFKSITTGNRTSIDDPIVYISTIYDANCAVSSTFKYIRGRITYTSTGEVMTSGEYITIQKCVYTPMTISSGYKYSRKGNISFDAKGNSSSSAFITGNVVFN